MQSARTRFREKMLITHRGLSGPAILQASSYWHPGQAIELDLAPGVDPHRRLSSQGMRDATQRPRSLHSAPHCQHAWPSAGLTSILPPTGPTHRSQSSSVTCTPGASRPPEPKATRRPKSPQAESIPNELDAKTMESRKVPGLYFIGEVVDVTGWLGGYNFQWAWASGASAGRAA